MKEKECIIIGHRGMRGLFSENSIEGFVQTVRLGFLHLELDVILSKDEELVVFHDSQINSIICDLPDSGKKNIYELSIAELAKVKCGHKINPKFPQQTLIPHHIPTLTELFTALQQAFPNRHTDLVYYIEIKSPKTYKTRQPSIEKLVDTLIDTVKKAHLTERIIVQSFDPKVLNYLNRIQPSLPTLFLIENLSGINYNLRKLNFTPTYYAPYFRLITHRTAKKLAKKNIRLATWTVNTLKKINQLKKLGADLIMSDYPNLIR